MATPIQTNNEAVRSFASGNYEEATALLQLAMRRQRLRHSIPNYVSCKNVGGTHRELLIHGITLPGPLQASLQKDNCNGISFFDRMFFISTVSDNVEVGSEGQDVSTESKVCALILYNMGISHHLEGIVRGSDQLLDKAFRVYQLALEFISAEPPSEVHYMLTMALMNNIAHIKSSWFNFEETDHCVKFLREATTYLEPPLLQDIDYMFFFLRYYVVPSNQISSSPAA